MSELTKAQDSSIHLILSPSSDPELTIFLSSCPISNNVNP